MNERGDLPGIPKIEMDLHSERIGVTPKQLSHPWTFVVSPYLVGYYPGGVMVSDTRPGGRHRDVTKLLASIRYRERHNIQLGIREWFQRMHIKYRGSKFNGKVNRWVILAILHGVKHHVKCDIQYLWKHGKIYPRKWM